MSQESEKIGFDTLLQFLANKADKEQLAPLKVGDKVVIDTPIVISYFIPEGLSSPIGKGFISPSKRLLKYFAKAQAIVIAIDLEVDYNCGHCDRTHTHDMLVNYPELGVNYYTKSSEFSLVQKKENL